MIKRETFEQSLLRSDIVEYYLNKSYHELVDEFGEKVARMVGFEQKNAHHCYDLWEHTLRTVESIDTTDLLDSEVRKLKVAAFFHDIGKPDVVGINPRTGEQNFYNHSVWSAEIAKPLLAKMEYSEEEINEICFYIAHHDDFISYKASIKSEQKFHAFIREVNMNTVSEVIIQNMFDFGKMGYPVYSVNNTKEENENLKKANELKLRFICSTLSNNGKYPTFKNYKGIPIKIWVDMKEIRNKINTGNYMASFVPNLRNYQLLIEICKADMRAQSDETIQNGEVVATKKGKLESFDKITEVIEEAYNFISNSKF